MYIIDENMKMVILTITMMLTVGLFLIYITFGNGIRRLTEEENAKLQKECGISKFDGTFSKKLKHFENMYGLDAQTGDFPWAVQILFIPATSANSNLTSTCSGSLISPWHVITASHCAPYKSNTIYKIIGGVTCTYDLLMTAYKPENLIECNNTVSPKVLTGESFIVPKDSNYFIVSNISETDQVNYIKSVPGTTFTDMAIIELNESIKTDSYIRPICLPSKHIKEGHESEYAIQYGYGITDEPDKENTILKWTVQRKCNYSDYDDYAIHERYLLKYCSEVAYIPCHGDNGGGLEIIINKRHTLIGLMAIALDRLPNTNNTCMPYKYDGELRNVPTYYPQTEIFTKFICYHIGVCPNGYHFKKAFDGFGAILGSFLKNETAFDGGVKLAVNKTTLTHDNEQQTKEEDMSISTRAQLRENTANHFEPEAGEEQYSTVNTQVPLQSSCNCHLSIIHILLLTAFYRCIYYVCNTI